MPMDEVAIAPIYEIYVRGPVGPTIAEALNTLSVERRGAVTVLNAPVPDQAALYGLLHRLEELGLELLALRRTPSAAGSASW